MMHPSPQKQQRRLAAATAAATPAAAALLPLLLLLSLFFAGPAAASWPTEWRVGNVTISSATVTPYTGGDAPLGASALAAAAADGDDWVQPASLSRLSVDPATPSEPGWVTVTWSGVPRADWTTNANDRIVLWSATGTPTNGAHPLVRRAWWRFFGGGLVFSPGAAPL